MKNRPSAKSLLLHLLPLALLGAAVCNLPAQNWQPTTAPTNGWFRIAASANGARLFAASGISGIWTSTNQGASWNQASLPAGAWNSVACSANGKVVVAGIAAVSAGPLYISQDGGTTWVSNKLSPSFWHSFACSADGSVIYALTRDQKFYQSPDTGATYVVGIDLLEFQGPPIAPPAAIGTSPARPMETKSPPPPSPAAPPLYASPPTPP